LIVQIGRPSNAANVSVCVDCFQGKFSNISGAAQLAFILLWKVHQHVRHDFQALYSPLATYLVLSVKLEPILLAQLLNANHLNQISIRLLDLVFTLKIPSDSNSSFFQAVFVAALIL
jgi:hypothetical protein